MVHKAEPYDPTEDINDWKQYNGRSKEERSFRGGAIGLVGGTIAGVVGGNMLASKNNISAKELKTKFKKSLTTKQKTLRSKISGLQSFLKAKAALPSTIGAVIGAPIGLSTVGSSIGKSISRSRNAEKVGELKRLEKEYDYSLTPVQKAYIKEIDKQLGRAAAKVLLGSFAGGVLGATAGYFIAEGTHKDKNYSGKETLFPRNK